MVAVALAVNVGAETMKVMVATTWGESYDDGASGDLNSEIENKRSK